MENEKKNDLLLNILVNPTFTQEDLAAVGVTADTSTINDYDSYKSNELVQKAFQTESGKFDEKAFKGFYDSALSMYNAMATDQQTADFSKYVSFHRDNFFAPEDKKRDDFDSNFIKLSNPYQITTGIAELGKPGERKKSIDEIAQAEKVLANPVGVSQGEDPIYHDSPNDSFFTDFFDTRVLAQWDKDGEHTDPITGEIQQHKKGDLKLNENGTFYYENLDGRSIYGRRVLNKMNTLTVDGSEWNKYDFFDSDDLKQNGVGKTLLKNAALVGTMFLPYVGPAVAGLSVATQAVGLFGTLGKILTGSDSPTFSAMEGWSKSVNRQLAKSEYAQENTWCLENWINLIGDVAGQLKEQRFIFEKIPAVFKGWGGASESLQAKKFKDLQNFYKKQATTKLEALTAGKNIQDVQKLAKASSELQAVAAVTAEREMNNFLKGYQKIGSVISKAYMNGITTLDTYGEAKEAGATDLEAAMVAIGYAAQEAVILNTGIGEWILPELRADKFKNKAIVKAITSGAVDTENAISKQSIKRLQGETKKQYVNRLFSIGKKIAKAEYANGTPAIKATLAGGLGEGIEEVVEELSADFTKSCYNTVKWLQGDDEHYMDAWDNAKDRYLMSFFGGMVGGSFTNAFTSYQGMRQLKSLTSEQAMQELVAMCRDKDQIHEFLKSVDKMDFHDLQIGNKNLTFDTEVDEDGHVNFKPGDKKNNQVLDIKKAIRKQVQLIQDTLNAEGASISDDSFLDQSSLKDLRFYALRNASTSGMYLQAFNTACADLVQKAQTLQDFKLSHKASTDAAERNKEKEGVDIQEEKSLEVLQKEYQDAQKKVQDFVQGKHAASYIRDALFEMTTELSQFFATPTLPLYAESLFNKKYSELSDEEKKTAIEKYEASKNGDGRQKIMDGSKLYWRMATSSSKGIKESEEYFRQMKEDPFVEGLRNMFAYNMYGPLAQLSTEDEELWMNIAEYNVQDRLKRTWEFLVGNGVDESQLQNLGTLAQSINQANEDLENMSETDPLRVTVQEQLKDLEKQYDKEKDKVFLDNLDQIFGHLLNQKFIHPEAREQLSEILKQKVVQIASLIDDGIVPLSTSEMQYYTQKLQQLSNIQNLISDLPNSPIYENVGNFSVATTGKYLDIFKLWEGLQEELKQATESKFRSAQLDSDLRESIENALVTLKMYKASILGARTDSADLLDLYGYNKTLNEINHKQGTENWTDLAEINSETADVFIADVDLLINKFEFAKKLMAINEGQKLIEQDKVSARLQFLNYDGVKTFVQILLDDDDPLKANPVFQELQNIISNECGLFEELRDQKIEQPTEDKQIQMTKLSLKIEDTLHELFSGLTEDDLVRILKPQKLKLYENKTITLNSETKEIDGWAFVSYLARCAAVKSSKLHRQYYETKLGSQLKYAPLTTQEANIFNQLASVLNGDQYTKFYNAARRAIKEDWASMSQADRKRYSNIEDKWCTDEMVKYCLNYINIPRYANFVLNEGGPGTGKTSACDGTVVEILKKYYKDVIDGAIVCHGADQHDESDPVKSVQQSQKLANNLNIDGAIVYNKKQLMNYVSPEYKEYTSDGEGNLQVPDTDYEINSEGELRSTLQVNIKSDAPKVIIIDEISQFNQYDIDLLQKFAERHGITVIVSGDFNQSQLVGSHPLTIEGETAQWTTKLTRNNFFHTYKMGLSMRTRNNLKSKNANEILAMQEDPSKATGTHTLSYYFDEQIGLIGDYVTTPDAQDKTYNYIDNMISKLADNEKIGYIYNDTTSELYRYVTTKYADKIDLKRGNAALGSEGKYYIIDINKSKITDSNKFLQDLYTGQTRSELGSIINFYGPDGKTLAPGTVIFNSTIFNSSIESSYKLEKLSEQGIKNYSEKKMRVLKNALEGVSDDIEYHERTKNTNGNTNGGTNGNGTTNGGGTNGATNGGTTLAPVQMAIHRSSKLRQLESRGIKSGEKFYMEKTPGNFSEYDFEDVEVTNTGEASVKYKDQTGQYAEKFDDFLTKINNGIIKIALPSIPGLDTFKSSLVRGKVYTSPTSSEIVILNFDPTTNEVQFIDEDNTIHTSLIDALYNKIKNWTPQATLAAYIDANNFRNMIAALQNSHNLQIKFNGVELPVRIIPWNNTIGNIGRLSPTGPFAIKLQADLHDPNMELCFIMDKYGKWTPVKSIADSNNITAMSNISEEINTVKTYLDENYSHLNLWEEIDNTIFDDNNNIDISDSAQKTAAEKLGISADIYNDQVNDSFSNMLVEIEVLKNLNPDDSVIYDPEDLPDPELNPSSEEHLMGGQQSVPFQIKNDGSLTALGFSFNTFETGVVWDNNGFVDINKTDYQNVNSKRIDSLNGLFNLIRLVCDPSASNVTIDDDIIKWIDSSNGSPTLHKSFVIDFIAQVRSALLTCTDKTELVNELKTIFNSTISALQRNYGFNVNATAKNNFLNSLSVQFGIKASNFTVPRNPSGYYGFTGNFARFDSNIDERLEYNDSTGTHSQTTSIPTKKLSAFITSSGTVGNATYNNQIRMEFPLITLNNALTIVQSDYFKNIVAGSIVNGIAATNSLSNYNGTDLFSAIQSVVSQGNPTLQHPKSIHSIVLELQEIIAHATTTATFTSTARDSVLTTFDFFNYATNQVVMFPSNVSTIGDLTFQPQSNTRSTQRGSTMLHPGLKYDIGNNQTPASQALRNPMMKKTKMYMAKTDVGPIKAGMPVVLYTFSPKYLNDQDIIDRFVQIQNDPNEVQDVYYAYMYTPMYTLEEHAKYVTDSAARGYQFGINNIFTSFHILYDAFMTTTGSNPGINIREMINFLGQNGGVKFGSNQRYSGQLNGRVENHRYGSWFAYRFAEKVAQFDPNKSLAQNIADLRNATVSMPDYNGGFEDVNFLKLCEQVFQHLAYKIKNKRATLKPNCSDIMDKLRNILKSKGKSENVRSAAHFMKQGNGAEVYNGLVSIQQDIDQTTGSPLYKINGKDCFVYGKLDSPAYNVACSEVMRNFLAVAKNYNDPAANNNEDTKAYVKAVPYVYSSLRASNGRMSPNLQQALTFDEQVEQIKAKYSILESVNQLNTELEGAKNSGSFRKSMIEFLVKTIWNYAQHNTDKEQKIPSNIKSKFSENAFSGEISIKGILENIEKAKKPEYNFKEGVIIRNNNESILQFKNLQDDVYYELKIKVNRNGDIEISNTNLPAPRQAPNSQQQTSGYHFRESFNRSYFDYFNLFRIPRLRIPTNVDVDVFKYSNITSVYRKIFANSIIDGTPILVTENNLLQLNENNQEVIDAINKMTSSEIDGRKVNEKEAKKFLIELIEDAQKIEANREENMICALWFEPPF